MTAPVADQGTSEIRHPGDAPPRGPGPFRPKPVYDSARRPLAFREELSQVWEYRHLIYQLVSRDIKSRYKRSVMGVAWTLLNPVMIMIVLTLVFSHFFRSAQPFYAVYVLSGTLLWNFFAQSSNSAIVQLVWGGSILNRIYMPRTVFALTAVTTGLVNMGLSLIPLAGIMLATGAPFSLGCLQFPLPILLVALFTIGVGLILSTLAISFPDVAEMYQIALTAWYFLTPVIYPTSILSPAAQKWMQLNPMYHLIELFRTAVEGRTPGPATLGWASLSAVGTFILGWLLFTSRSDEINYRV